MIDTSVLLGTDVDDGSLPDEGAISAATLAEVHFGVHMATTDASRKARLRRLVEIESRLETLPIDASVARSYGALAHAVATAGRSPRRRVMDILIAATAHAHRVAVYTRDRRDFSAFEPEIEIRVV